MTATFLIRASRSPSSHTRRNRFLAAAASRAPATECVASLIARSPGTRNRIRGNTEYYPQRIGLADWEASKTLIAANQRGLHDCYVSSLRSGGRFAILFSDSVEFIFGDGMLHNFPIVVGNFGSLKCVCPILPTAIALYTRLIRYVNSPTVITMRLDDQEVKFFNDTVQAYSKDYVFYRSQRPISTEAFARGAHLEYSYHSHEWLDRLMHNVARFRPNGRTQTEDSLFTGLPQGWP